MQYLLLYFSIFKVKFVTKYQLFYCHLMAFTFNLLGNC